MFVPLLFSLDAGRGALSSIPLVHVMMHCAAQCALTCCSSPDCSGTLPSTRRHTPQNLLSTCRFPRQR